MLRLVLSRHANAAANAPGGDLDRPLNTRGLGEAMRMGRYLAAERIRPSIAVVSRARRTRETMDILLRELASHAGVPVINGLTKRSHPCQVAADIMTFEERIGRLDGRLVAWTGDANNVLNSWVQAATKIPFTLRIATPAELAPQPATIAAARALGARIEQTTDPEAAVAGADCVITDCWVSMGDKDEGRRQNLLRRYQVDRALMDRAGKDAIFMHCLPATRGEEVTDEVMDGPRSAVFDEAENRLHAQKAILAHVFGETIA